MSKSALLGTKSEDLRVVWAPSWKILVKPQGTLGSFYSYFPLKIESHLGTKLCALILASLCPSLRPLALAKLEASINRV